MKRRGFTLVELAIVIAILGILAMYAIPKYQGMVEEARTAQAKAQLGTVRSALAIYYAKNSGKFPAQLDGSIFAEGNVPYVEATDANGNVVKSNSVVNVNHVPVASSDITDKGGWVYGVSSDLTQSDVRINAKGTGVDGTPWY
ncbi:MAG: prepilin-type N-terminal cleavage/methylation domain-containing protein, partial [Caldisericum sp.]|nr:prepilin-type N-terminal cleavage/methylation domain-containing protein [Caldisericum sp.]